MTRRPKRPCSKIGCRAITDERYCDDHKGIADEQRKERHRHYDRHHRDQQAATFYKSVPWQRARQAALMRDMGLCRHCLPHKRVKQADMVHHIKPIRQHWELRLKLNNLISLCHSCHAKIDHGGE